MIKSWKCALQDFVYRVNHRLKCISQSNLHHLVISFEVIICIKPAQSPVVTCIDIDAIAELVAYSTSDAYIPFLKLVRDIHIFLQKRKSECTGLHVKIGICQVRNLWTGENG